MDLQKFLHLKLLQDRIYIFSNHTPQKWKILSLLYKFYKVNIRSRNGDIELNSIKIANSILGESGMFIYVQITIIRSIIYRLLTITPSRRSG